MTEHTQTIIIEGVKLNRKDYPNLYDWAKQNPDWLAETLRNGARKLKTTPANIAQSLESDLEHARLSGYHLERDEERL